MSNNTPRWWHLSSKLPWLKPDVAFDQARLRTYGLFAVLVGVLLLVSLLVTGSLLPGAGLDGIWFYSGLAMVLFSMFFIEPYYTAPKNVMAHSVAVCLVLLSIRDQLPNGILLLACWRTILVYSAIMLGLALTAILLSNRERSPTTTQNRIAAILTAVVTRFGTGTFQYSGMFLLFIVFFHDSSSPGVLAAMVFWWVLVVTQPHKLIQQIQHIRAPRNAELGEIIGIQSRRLFLAKLHKDRPAIGKFDTVTFCYSMDEEVDRRFEGVVFDSYLLNQERWIKILQLESASRSGFDLRPNAVYRTVTEASPAITAALSTFVGVVRKGSDIAVIRFEYSAPEIDLQEGDLVGVRIGRAAVYYQVVNGVTATEPLEAKNEAGSIQAEAVQLGVWNVESQCFEKYGWVPEVNAVVYKILPEAAPPPVEYPEYILGTIPGTFLPATINLHTAVSHHLAVLGVTGSGKSFLTLEIIQQLSRDTKVICIDFTGEYYDLLRALNPTRLLNTEAAEQVEALMAQRADAERVRQQGQVLALRQQIQDRLGTRVSEFIASQDMVTLFELPDLSNSSFILEFTQLFLDAVFKYAKANPGKRICIVIEEAHTVVPETSSLGDLGDYGSNKALVNKIGQIALQGRKYGVGFIIVAQRTANVSKTVLTQCNTIIAFQAFDETSFRFLENHVGSQLVAALPKLKPFHAVAVGKAFRGNVPMIIDLTRDTSGTTPISGIEDGPAAVL